MTHDTSSNTHSSESIDGAMSTYSFELAWVHLGYQLMAILTISIFFALKDIISGLSALSGGMAAWLPNFLFILLAIRLQGRINPSSTKVSWGFAFSEIAKIASAIILMLASLSIFRSAYHPLVVTWFSAVIVQILAPVFINSEK